MRRKVYDDSLTSPGDCRDLWAAKLLAYFHDALQPRQSGVNLDPITAQSWFESEDFFLTCLCAGVDARSVQRKLKERLKLANEGQNKAASSAITERGAQGYD